MGYNSKRGLFWKYPLSRIYPKSTRIFLYLYGDIYGIYGKFGQVFGDKDISGENVSYFNCSAEINTKGMEFLRRY